QVVADRYQPVRIGAGVAVAAHRGCHGPERDFAVTIDATGDVAQAVGGGRPGQVGGRVGPDRIVAHRVRLAQAQPGLQRIGEVPALRRRIDYPFLQAGGGLRRGVRVQVPAAGVAIAFV